MKPIDETTVLRPRWDARELMPVIAQEVGSGRVLMLAYANEAALRATLRTGEAHYWSRSRGELWHKGATSGAIQKVARVLIDCDQDALLYQVSSGGAACHTGRADCFYREVRSNADQEVNLAFTDGA